MDRRLVETRAADIRDDANYFQRPSNIDHFAADGARVGPKLFGQAGGDDRDQAARGRGLPVALISYQRVPILAMTGALPSCRIFLLRSRILVVDDDPQILTLEQS